MEIRKHIDWIFIGVLIMFHIIGTVLILTTENGAELSHLNLLLCGTLVFLSEKNKRRALLPLVVIFVGGYLLEFIGVHTGVLFGSYSYGANLGPKLFEIPIVMGANWYCMVVATSSLTFTWKIPKIVKAVVAGLLCALMDVLIEPVAIQNDFWSWNTPEIPLFNYICWWFFASIFAYIYLSFAAKVNRTARALFLIWLIFFTILNFGS